MDKFEFAVLQDDYERAIAFLTERVPQGWEENLSPVDGRTWFTFHLEDHPLAEELARELAAAFPGSDLKRSEVDPQDWAMAWRDFFTPVQTGETFEVLPPWLAEQRDARRKSIIIEPKMAFGTGHHPTTALCLAAIGSLAESGRLDAKPEFLDLGTGSGILAIGLALLGCRGVALDIDPQAVACAEENLAANHVADMVSTAVGSIDCLRPERTFGLIVANILSGPLIALSRPVHSHLAPGSALVLSGILTEQAPSVARTYAQLGLGEPKTHIEGEWAALVWA
ncbi:ribosomal L11 methyltransferase [Desulfovibrio sp. X2]|uniref:50S ribosomal protein L11 methyltransferase n=1 Tax=Desulfovibrio sp. X2 TaxID=941449 RepID=UPI000358BF2F|nr:50S ribosomal protein L11 methyltransferase [Desulfovibrio sp. X2]EPR42402.1 ribosomal L11 methyltransferase [Desulfovibrio sp. X2]